LLRARERLLVRAAGLGPRADSAAFCKNVPHNAQTLRLAGAQLGPVRAAVADSQICRNSK
jgi:hypothetical protein